VLVSTGLKGEGLGLAAWEDLTGVRGRSSIASTCLSFPCTSRNMETIVKRGSDSKNRLVQTSGFYLVVRVQAVVEGVEALVPLKRRKPPHDESSLPREEAQTAHMESAECTQHAHYTSWEGDEISKKRGGLDQD
jgi:hypothetical protein